MTPATRSIASRLHRRGPIEFSQSSETLYRVLEGWSETGRWPQLSGRDRLELKYFICGSMHHRPTDKKLCKRKLEAALASLE